MHIYYKSGDSPIHAYSIKSSNPIFSQKRSVKRKNVFSTNFYVQNRPLCSIVDFSYVFQNFQGQSNFFRRNHIFFINRKEH